MIDMDIHTDNDLKLTVPEGDRSPQDWCSGDIVPVPASSTSSHGLPGVCTAGTMGERTTAKMAEDPLRVEATDDDGTSPAKEEIIVVSEGEGEGEVYVSSLEDPPTLTPKPRRVRATRGRPGARIIIDNDTPSPCGEDEVNSRSRVRLNTSRSDGSPEGGAASANPQGGVKVSRRKRKKAESSSELEQTGESGSQRKLRPRGVRTFNKCARPSKKRMRSATKRDSDSEEGWSRDEGMRNNRQ